MSRLAALTVAAALTAVSVAPQPAVKQVRCPIQAHVSDVRLLLAAHHAVTLATMPAPEPTDTVWDAIGSCESGAWQDGRPHGPADWHYNDGRFLGGLNWLLSTWNAVAPAGFPGPVEATREHEIVVAELLMAMPWGSFEHWPTCARLVGVIE